MQLVLEPGFSTAGALTQQAGRGVGMDVVATEIKQLGGALHMETKPGERHAYSRSACRSRSPSATRWWCAPAMSTTRCRCRRWKAWCGCRATEVAAHLRARRAEPSTTAARSTACSHWRCSSGMEASPLPEQDVTIPVVLVRAGEHSTGLVADELIGSREIVVKSVGPADLEHPRHLRGHHPRRWPHRHHSRHRCAGARRMARPRRRRPSRANAPTGAPSRWWWTTRSRCGA